MKSTANLVSFLVIMRRWLLQHCCVLFQIIFAFILRRLRSAYDMKINVSNTSSAAMTDFFFMLLLCVIYHFKTVEYNHSFLS